MSNDGLISKLVFLDHRIQNSGLLCDFSALMSNLGTFQGPKNKKIMLRPYMTCENRGKVSQKRTSSDMKS